MLPNVVVIGGHKCGTTALYQRFASHPDCAVCRDLKEPHFFVDEGPVPIGNWRRGVEWYSGLFDEARIVADVCPSYAAWPLYPGVAERARAVVPDASIVYLVRDPIDRIVSHWMHWRARGYDRRPLDEAVLDPDPQNEYLPASRYGSQLSRWLDQFPGERVLVLHQRQLAAGDDGLLWERLGVAPPPPGDTERWNVSGGLTESTVLDRLPKPLRGIAPRRVRRRPIERPAVAPETRARLRELLSEDIALFHRISDVRLEGWPG